MSDFLVTVADQVLEGSWLETNRDTREAVLDAFPVEGMASRWGDELFFDVPVHVDPSDLHTIVEPGTIAYWPAGPAICLFWGPTPASTDEMPVAASPVAPLAIVRDVAPLQALEGEAAVTIAESIDD